MNNCHQQGDQHDGGGVDPAEAIDKALNGCATLLGLFNQLQDAVDGALTRSGEDRELYQTIDAGGACRHFLAR